MKTLLGSLLVAGSVFVLGSCQSAKDDPVTDTNTNWLEECDESSSCGDLACVCNRCTRECESDADCAGLADDAVCIPLAEASCGATSVCVQSGAATDADDAGPEDAPADDTSPDDTDALADDTGIDDADASRDDTRSDDSDTPDQPGQDDVSVANDDGSPPGPSTTSTTSEGCAGEATFCPEACGGSQAAECMAGVWVCPPLTNRFCQCEGDPIECPDGCGGTSAGVCVDGTWVCLEPGPAECPEDEAGGGNAGSGGTTASGGASSGGAAGTSAGGTTSSNPCDTAVIDRACDSEGMRCGDCASPCEFCNILVCSQGVWGRLEAAPAPCFECGMALRCQQYQWLCRIESGAVYDEECVQLPPTCMEDMSCGCLESEMPEFMCTELAPGSFVVERSDSTPQ